MSYFEAPPPHAHAQALQGDLVARIADFLSRKSAEVPVRVQALYRAIERKIQAIGLRRTLRSLTAQVQGTLAAGMPAAGGTRSRKSDPEWGILVRQIQAYRLDETIENYSEYLFSMDTFDPKAPW